MKIRSDCVQCGFCCSVAPCLYGRWDAKKQKCQFLNADSTCAKYEQIVKIEKDSPMPMMGCGCSSTMFNERREAKIKLDSLKICDKVTA